jgi:hypothetical protein
MSSATTNAASSSPLKTLPKLGKTLLKLAPRQLQDEIQIGLLELKKKGVGLGVAAGFFVGALVFLSFMITTLLVSLVAVIAGDGHLALVALLVAAGFLVILAILALIGLGRLKKSLPLKPNRAIHGIKKDLGVIKEGRTFDERSLVDTRTKEQREADAKRAQAEKDAKKRQEKIDKGIDPDAKPLTLEQLMALTAQRRQNIASTRDELMDELPITDPAKNKFSRFTTGGQAGDHTSGAGSHAPSVPTAEQLKAAAAEKLGEAKAVATEKAGQAKNFAAEKAASARQAIEDRRTAAGTVGRTTSQGSVDDGGSVVDRLKERKGAVAAAGASLSAFAVLASRLSNKK